MNDATDDDVALDRPRQVHVIGVGGAGMRAIASVLAAMGHRVSGTDMKSSPGLDRLRAEGVAVTIGHDAAAIADADLVTRSTAVPDSNPEVVAAHERSVPVASRADVLAAMTRVRRSISVAGTHGKTTTSSMLALVLVDAGMDPSFIIGGDVNEIGSGAAWSDVPDGWFVVEADESDGTFLRLDSSAAVLTSIEPDHLSHYGGTDALEEAFARFAGGVKGPLVACVDDAGVAALVRRLGEREPGEGPGSIITYGTAAEAMWRIEDHVGRRAGCRFTVVDPDGERHEVDLATPGLHNARNATGALAAAVALGAPVSAGLRALARFGGVARRFQFRGERDGVTYIDDYAHLPTEVEAALEAAAGGGWDRIVCVFQPHRYTRTRDLWSDFGGSFDRAGLVVVTDIYGSGEQPIPGVTGKLVADAVLDGRDGPDVAYLPHREDLVSYLRARLRPGDLCLTLGAGDLTTLPDELLALS